jgi:hypothetical protein
MEQVPVGPLLVDLSHWRGAPRPERMVLKGCYARLEPLTSRQR